MPTMFPKSYIIERIDARIASIARQGVEDAGAIVAGDARERELVLEWLARVARAAEDISIEAHERFDALQATTVAFDDLIAKARGLDRDMPGAPTTDGWGRSVSDADKATFDFRRVARERMPKAVREGNSLEHARAYLVDTPVEAFSKTDLRDLGLLDVIKFRLEAVRG